MNRPITRIARENHLNHLVQILPFITTIFGIQCILIYEFVKDINVGDYAMFMGLSLVGFIYSLFYYDNNHKIFLYPTYIKIIPIIGIETDLYYTNIESINAPEEECNFSTLIVNMKNKERYIFYFIDYPKHVKEYIESEYMNNDSNSDQAA